MSKYKKFIFQNIMIALILILSYLFLPKILIVLAPFITAFCITEIFKPITKKLSKIIKNRHICSLVTLIIIVTIIGGLLYFLISGCLTAIRKLIQISPQLINDATITINSLVNKIESHELFKSIEGINLDGIDEIIGEKIMSLIDTISEVSINFAASSINYVWPVFLFVLFTILAIYFINSQAEELRNGITKLFGEKKFEKVKTFYDENIVILFQYLKAQVKISLMIFAIILIYSLIFHFSYALLFSIIVTLVDALPVAGTGFVLCPLCVIYLLSGNYRLALLYIILYVITLAFRQMIQPKMIGKEIGINPFTTLLLMYAGYILHGFVGMIVILPIYIIIKNLYKMGLFDSYIQNVKMIIADIKKYIY